MEFIERIDISLIKKLNLLTYELFIKYYYENNDYNITSKELKNIFNNIKSFCFTNLKNDGITKRIYKYSSDTLSTKGGRLYCGKSVQGLPKFIRGYLMKHTTDIDAENCQPTILKYLCYLHNINCPKLNFYIENRTNILQNNNLTKIDFIKSMNNDKLNKRINDLFFKEFDEELKVIQEKICNINEYQEILNSVPKDKQKTNWRGSALNRILGMYENNILQEVINIIKNSNIEIAVLMFDGLMIYGDYYNNQLLLNKITRHVEEKFNGLNMIWTYKEHCNNFIISDIIENNNQKLILPEFIEKIIENPYECVLANIMKELYGDKYYFIEPNKKQWIEYKNNLWMESVFGMRPLIDTTFYQNIKTYLNKINKRLEMTLKYEKEYDELFNKSKILQDICKRLQKTVDKNNIIKELQEKCFNPNFILDMNKEKYKLPLKNGKIINLKTLEIRNRNIKDKFNYECPINFINLDEKQKQFAEKYFLDLFCQNQNIVKCVIDILKSAISGEKLRYIFFCTGSGRNGKSLLFKLLKIIFSKSIDIISELVIINSKNGKSQINTEMEKLDKIRIGYVTELKEEDKLNSDIIKRISGGDDIDLRSLHQTNRTITPTSNLFVLTNELPKFKVEQALIDRIVVIPFKNRFEVNSNYENLMLENINIIFSYIMTEGKILDKFNFTNEMLEAKNDYIENNNSDYLKEFIETNVSNNIGKNIKREIFRKKYNEWCTEMSYPIDNRTDRLFSRFMTKYGIENASHNGIRVYKNIEFNH